MEVSQQEADQIAQEREREAEQAYDIPQQYSQQEIDDAIQAAASARYPTTVRDQLRLRRRARDEAREIADMIIRKYSPPE